MGSNEIVHRGILCKVDSGIGVWEKPVYQIVNRKWIRTLFGTL